MRVKLFLACAFAIIFIVGCKKKPVATEAVHDETPYEWNLINNTLPVANLPADNPLTVQKVHLGKMLFYERAMSLGGTISCGSCHNQENAFSDINQFSEGVGGAVGGRQAMAIFNMAWNNNEFFWDGRAHLLRDQALGPIENPLEMRETLEGVIVKLEDMGYADDFVRAFGTKEITPLKISLALENFMMSIVSDDSKYDRYLAGIGTLTDSEEKGRILFFGEYNEFFPASSGADCAHCHAGNNFENDLYMNNGLDEDANFVDYGREDATSDITDRAKFKVTSLRNIEVTPPYMHDGRFQTLEEVVDHYNSNVQNSSTVDPALLGTTSTGLMLDETEKADLVNFLKTLTDYTFLNNPDYANPFPPPRF